MKCFQIWKQYKKNVISYTVYLLFMSVEREYVSELQLPAGLLLIFQVKMNMESQDGMIVTG
jgi:hypothetical protein